MPQPVSPDDQTRPARRRNAWFVCLAPITVPAYLLYLAILTVVAGCYYITIDQTLARLLRRPITLAGAAFAWAALLFVPLTLIAVVAHTAIWLMRQLGRFCVGVGRWQTGLATRERVPIRTPGHDPAGHAAAHEPRTAATWAAGACGAAWTAVFAWCLVACVDPQGSLAILGRDVPGAAEMDQACRKGWTLAQLSPESQARRRALLDSTLPGGANSEDRWGELVREYLERDTDSFAALPHALQVRVTGLPWWYQLAMTADDNASHGTILTGALLLTLLLMIRWPGLFGPRWPISARLAAFVLRVAATLAAVLYAFWWMPEKVYIPLSPVEAWWYRLVCPGMWLGLDPNQTIPPQWRPLNAALWLVLAGIAAMVWSAAVRLRPWLGPPGFYTAYLAVRLLQRKRIAFFSIGAVTLCVAMELIVISVMGGFLDTIRERSHSLVGDLVIDGGLTGFPLYQEFIDELSQWPEIQAATPVIHSYGVIRFDSTSRVKAVEVKGIRLDEYRRINSFADAGKEGLYYDKYYPGTTVFAPASQPLYGFDDANVPVLPPPFEAAWRRYLDSLSAAEREKTLDRWPRVAGGSFTGPGVFELSADLKPTSSAPALPGVVVGRDLIAPRMPSGEYQRSAQYPRGARCTLTLLPLSRSGTIKTDAPLKPQLRYIDDSRTGVYEIDSRVVYLDFDYLQYLLDMNALPRAAGGTTRPRCTSIQVRLRPGSDLHAARVKVQRAWDRLALSPPKDLDADEMNSLAGVGVSTWEELQRDFIAAIEKEKVLTVIMFGIISVVAVLLVLCIFYMIVVEKTRDIGIIKSVGGSAQGVAAVFLTYGAAIGVSGAALGTLLGATFVRHINGVQDWLARLNPAWRVWSPETYSFDKIPDVVKTGDVAWIAGLAVVASILGAVVPAIRAARTWPVEALRYE